MLYAWGWRQGGDVWVEFEKSSPFSTSIKVQKNNIFVVQDGKEFSAACLAREDWNECGSFSLTATNYVLRLDHYTTSDTYVPWNYKKSFTIHYAHDDLNSISLDAAQTMELKIVADPPEGGTASGAGDYEAGESVSLSATPASGYRFSHWGSDNDDDQGNKTYTMPGDNTTLTANFVPGSQGTGDSKKEIVSGGCFIRSLESDSDD